jgi:hypothetical protein
MVTTFAPSCSLSLVISCASKMQPEVPILRVVHSNQRRRYQPILPIPVHNSVGSFMRICSTDMIQPIWSLRSNP